jgi:hypothetical protein
VRNTRSRNSWQSRVGEGTRSLSLPALGVSNATADILPLSKSKTGTDVLVIEKQIVRGNGLSSMVVGQRHFLSGPRRIVVAGSALYCDAF